MAAAGTDGPSKVGTMSMEVGVVADAVRHLGQIYRGVLTRHGIDQIPELQIDPPLDKEEARFFLGGIEHDLFSINEDGYAQSRFLPDKRRGTTYQQILPVYWRTRKGPLGRWVLFREGVCQLALASSMVLKYGWGKSQVQMEPPISQFGELAYAVDLLVRSDDGQIVICGEVKKNLIDIEKFLKGFAHCCERGSGIRRSNAPSK